MCLLSYFISPKISYCSFKYFYGSVVSSHIKCGWCFLEASILFNWFHWFNYFWLTFDTVAASLPTHFSPQLALALLRKGKMLWCSCIWHCEMWRNYVNFSTFIMLLLFIIIWIVAFVGMDMYIFSVYSMQVHLKSCGHRLLYCVVLRAFLSNVYVTERVGGGVLYRTFFF